MEGQQHAVDSDGKEQNVLVGRCRNRRSSWRSVVQSRDVAGGLACDLGSAPDCVYKGRAGKGAGDVIRFCCGLVAGVVLTIIVGVVAALGNMGLP